VIERTDGEILHKRIQQFEDAVTVYPVSCEKLAAGRSDKQWLDGVLAGGAKIVQLRDKISSDNVLLEKAKYFRTKTREAKALFIVNDRVDIAMMAGADGVHVGQKDLPPNEVRNIASDIIIGVSCNTTEDVKALAALKGSGDCPVNYYNIGPLFVTETKEGLTSFLGIEAVSHFSKLCSLPFTVMGGIKEHHVADLVKAGVQRIAVVTAISEAEDIRAETARWMRMINESSNERSE